MDDFKPIIERLDRLQKAVEKLIELQEQYNEPMSNLEIRELVRLHNGDGKAVIDEWNRRRKSLRKGVR